MPSPNPLQQLFARYKTLENREPRQLTFDEERSLRFYRAEQEIRHQSALSEPSVNQVHVWIRNVLDLELFVARNYQLPRVNRRRRPMDVSDEERRLEQWLNYQTRPTTILRQCSYQADRLAIIPGYSANRLDDQWQGHYEQYRSFLAEHRRAPALRSADPLEKTLAAWGAKQRLHRRNGSLPAHRAAALMELDMWSWGAASKKATE